MVSAKLIAVLAIAISAIKADETKMTAQGVCGQMPAGATILRPNSCTNWVKCPTAVDAQDYEEGACVYGLYFNKDEGRCQSKDEVDCPYELGTKNRCANKDEGTFLYDPDNCNAYFFCKNGRETHSSCPGDLVFHPEKAACVYPLEYRCPEKVEKAPANPLCRSVREGMFFASAHECIIYHECINNALTTHECDQDMGFDYILGACTHKTNVTCHPSAKPLLPDSTICGTKDNPRVGYFADEESCSGYYICAKTADGPDRNPKHLKCQKGYFFDGATWSCRDRMNVKCTLDRCEGIDKKYVNVAGDCTAYARCSNGVTINTGKCQGNYYFDERTQGCTPQNVNYIACSA